MKNIYLSFFSALFIFFCYSSVNAQPGATCAEAVVVSSVPYTATGLTTVGTTYAGIACSGSFPNYMSGADYVFKFTPTVTQNYGIVLSNTGYSTGLFVTSVCPDNASVACIANSNSLMGNPSVSAVLNAGTLYYITVSTVSMVAATTNFDILIDACVGTPVSGFTYSATNLDVTFTNTTTGATTYSWFFGDELLPFPYLAGSTDVDPIHTFTAYGDHQIILIATNSCGGADTLYQTITLICPGDDPVSSFTYSQTGADVSFQSTSSYADSVNWYFGDELIPFFPSDNTLNPTHTYTANGTYTVQCIAYNECGSDTSTQIITITTVSAGSLVSENITVTCYPVPAESILNINISGNQTDVQIILTDNLGRVVYTVKGKINRHAIDLAELSKGIYTINVITGTSNHIQKVLIN